MLNTEQTTILNNSIENILGIESQEFKDSSTLRHDLGADSLEVIEIIMELERDLNIQVPDEVVDDIITVGDLKAETLKLLEK